MLRSIVAVVVTYIVMSILIIAGFMGLLYGAGFDRLMEPGTFKGSMLMNIAAPSITVLCGLFGGWMCGTLARKTTPVLVLAGLVLFFGMLTAYFTLQKPEPTGPRPPNMTMTEFMEKGREPTWFALLNPVFGAGAVLLGGLFLAKPKKQP